MENEETHTHVYEVEVTNHPEFGQCFSAICPDCGTEIREFTYMRGYNILTCQCPKEWTFTLRATGVPKEPANDTRKLQGKAKRNRGN